MSTTTDSDKLSPFEFKDTLIQLAKSAREHMMLNAGRGNPNFLATQPRHAFLRLGDFAMQEAERSYSYLSSGFAGMPEQQHITTRFDAYCIHNEGAKGIDFIRAVLAFAEDHLGMSKSDLLHELTLSFLGCEYPVPPRMLSLSETLVKRYLSLELCGSTSTANDFDAFATEGGTAAMTYFFQTLKLNRLIAEKDKIAIITPIFSPYLEIPVVPSYNLEIVEIQASEEDDWQIPSTELDKLLDPAIKVLCMVNPSNPPSVKMNGKGLEQLANIVKEKRSDLMIVTDDVYATFSDDFRSVFAICPYNTLCVYSFSKYFGATGWRLGAMLVHHHNVFDDLLAKLPEEDKLRLDERYSSLTDSPRSLKFIDRLVADSRSVALNHTAGLSLPQQLQMTLFALSSLLDEGGEYKKEAKRLIRRRYRILYDAMEIPIEQDENSVDYYTLIDLEKLSAKSYGQAFSDWMMKNISGYEFLIQLAQKAGVVLLPGKGFEVVHPSARVSLANLKEHDYRLIGLAVREILQELYNQYQLA
jgi:aspartate 4-decarboxylase